MTDDWSLKNRYIIPYPQNLKQYLKFLQGTKIYSGDDIETLRQKLIEDIKKILNKASLMEWSCKETYEKIEEYINKRFGVD